MDKTLAFQIRTLRDNEGWTQAEFAERLGIRYQNNVSARLENPNYGKHTLTTLKKIAAACDVGLVVWFVPFGRLIDWASCTPRVDTGLTSEFYDIPSFSQEFAALGTVPTSELSKNKPTHTMGLLGSISAQPREGAMGSAA